MNYKTIKLKGTLLGNYLVKNEGDVEIEEDQFF